VFYNRLNPEHQNAMSKILEKIHFRNADFQGVFGTPGGAPATRSIRRNQALKMVEVTQERWACIGCVSQPAIPTKIPEPIGCQLPITDCVLDVAGL
jgi:hypothetical protein